MDSYTEKLLGMAVEAADGQTFITWKGEVTGNHLAFAETSHGTGATLPEALAALLTDLGVEVPERPSAEDVKAEERWHDVPSGGQSVLRSLRALYAREPLTVLALLEGGE